MKWLKLHVGLRHNKEFLRLSLAAKVAFFGALMAAADYEQNGALLLRSGPLTASELATDLFLSREKAALAVRELIHAGFLSEGENGVLSVAKWDEKTASKATLRVRKHREKQRLETLHEALHETLNETLPVTRRGNVEEEGEEDIPSTPVDKSTSVLGPKGSTEATDTTWVAPLKVAAQALARKLLSQLDPDERFTLGRYHALRFGNCTVNERKNKRAGTKVAAGIGGLAADSRYGQITVQQYVNFAVKVHEQRESAPWFDPWLLKAVVEFERC